MLGFPFFHFKKHLHCLAKKKKNGHASLLRASYQAMVTTYIDSINEVATYMAVQLANNLSKYSNSDVWCSLLWCMSYMVYSNWTFSNWKSAAGMACAVRGGAGFLWQRCRSIYMVAHWHCPIFHTGDVHIVIGSSQRCTISWMFGVSSCVVRE